MIIHNVSQVGSPEIRKQSRKVKNFQATEVKKTTRDLVDSMRHYQLVGMAAPQTGKNIQVFVTEIRSTQTRKRVNKDHLRVFINPRIISRSKKLVTGFEGCGSVADAQLFGAVPRVKEIIIQAFDTDGKRFELRAAGLLARVIQHELDHLQGKVFLDRMQSMKTIMGRKEYIAKSKKII